MSEEMDPPRADARPPMDLRESMDRMDALLTASDEPGKLQAGLGIRLALGMAHELKEGLPLGTETAALVAGWMEAFDRETVDGAVAIAREFLTKPEALKQALGRRLGLEAGT